MSEKPRRGTLKAVFLTLAVTALALVGFNVVAGAAGGGGWFAGHGRGGHDMHAMAANLVAKLDLRADQQVFVESLHETLSGLKHARAEHAPEHLHQVLNNIAAGDLDPAEGRAMVDLHIDRLRAAGYQISDDLSRLANSLDQQQRATLVDHFETLHRAHQMLMGQEGDEASDSRRGHRRHGGHGQRP